MTTHFRPPRAAQIASRGLRLGSRADLVRAKSPAAGRRPILVSRKGRRTLKNRAVAARLAINNKVRRGRTGA